MSEQNNNKITFFNSQEQEEEHYRWLVSLTPLEHLEDATKLIKRIYAKELAENSELGINLKFEVVTKEQTWTNTVNKPMKCFNAQNYSDICGTDELQTKSRKEQQQVTLNRTIL